MVSFKFSGFSGLPSGKYGSRVDEVNTTGTVIHLTYDPFRGPGECTFPVTIGI